MNGPGHDPLLEVDGLGATAGPHRVLDGVSFTVRAGTVLAVVGRSGSGKTTLGLAALGQPRSGMRLSGRVRIDGRELLGTDERTRRAIRAGVVGHLPQHPAAVLDPVRRCRGALDELAALRHRDRAGRAAEVRAALAATGLGAGASGAGVDGLELAARYPHQLSGGQQQRMALATTLVTRPRLLVLDEPTTGLDTVSRADLIERLRGLVAEGTAVLLLTHDLPAVRALAGECAVLDAGRVVAAGPADAVLHREALLTPVPQTTGGGWPGSGSGAPVAGARGLTVRARDGARLLDDVHIAFPRGSRTAVVGASGAGKTTLGRALAGLTPARAGTVEVDGVPLPPSLRARSRRQRRAVQYVHQDPRASFDEYRPVLGQIAATGRRLRGLPRSVAEQEAVRLAELLDLREEHLARRPGALSGGELQRCALARCLLAHPTLLVCDEVTSALDGISQAMLLRALSDTVARTGTTLVLIGHDLATLLPAVDRVAVLDGGRCVEQADAHRFRTAPESQAGTALVRALPAP